MIPWFWFSFPWWLVILYTFSCTCWPSVSSLKKYLFSSSAHFLIILFALLLLRCMSSLHFLILSSYIRYVIACVFSYSVVLSFSVLSWFLLLSRSFIAWCSPHLCTFSLPLSFIFLPLLLVSNPKKNCQDQYQGYYHLCFLLGVLWLQVLCSSHFQLIFLYVIREWSCFILLHVAIQFFQFHYWKDCPLLLL